MQRVVQPKGASSKTIDTRRIIITDECEYEIPQDANLVESKLKVKPGSNVSVDELICKKKFSLRQIQTVKLKLRLKNGQLIRKYMKSARLKDLCSRKKIERYNKVVIREVRELPLKGDQHKFKRKSCR